MKRYLIAIIFFACLGFAKYVFARCALSGKPTEMNAPVVIKEASFKIIADEKGVRRLPDVNRRGKILRSVIIPVELINNSNDTLKYWSWTCSWQDIYKTDRVGVSVAGSICEKNVPVIVNLAPHTRSIVKLPLDYNEFRVKKNFEVRVGMYLQTNLSTPVEEISYMRENNRFIWSNKIMIKNR